MYLTNVSLYTWTRQVAEWAWEPESMVQAALHLAEDVADASRSGADPALGIGDTSPVLGVATSSEALYEASAFATALVASTVVSASAVEEHLDEEASSSLVVDAVALGKPASLPLLPTRERPVEIASAPKQVQPLEQGNGSSRPADHPRNAPLEGIEGESPPRGRWVLKGYRTEIAFSVNPADLGHEAMDRLSIETTEAEKQERHEQRKGKKVVAGLQRIVTAHAVEVLGAEGTL